MVCTMSLFLGKILAQPVAGFTVDTTQACAPATIICTNTTTNCSGTVSYNWSITGDPQSSTLQNPVFNFSNGGDYTIILQVTCVEGTDTYTDTHEVDIIIWDSPRARFDNTLMTGCVPFEASFTDLTVPGDGTDLTYTWYFNDGFTSTDQNPTHTYNAGGSYNVSLIVEDENGCTSDTTALNVVRIATNPDVNFYADNPTMCIPPHTVNFTSTVTTSFGLNATYVWDFGDGATSTEQNPSHQYNAGVFDVTLTVTDEYGCDSTFTIEEYIRVTNTVAEYSVQPGSTVCRGGQTTFVNETGYSCLWNFGDGGISTQNTPVHVYGNAGDVTVTFTVDPGGLCEADTSFVLTVETVSASFTTNPANLFSCTAPFTVNFTNTSSSNATTFYYSFDGTGTHTSLEENPSYTYNAAGTFTPTLTVTTDAGCMHAFIGPIVNIATPSASFIGDTIEGCAPRIVNFTYTGGSTIETYNWSFGNGQTNPDGAANETSVYNPGEYTATLIVTDINGCTASSTVDVTVGIHNNFPTGVFDNDSDHSVLPDHFLCAQDTISFYLENWDDENYEFTWWVDSSSNQDPTDDYTDHAYDQDTGFVYLHLITNDRGCIDTTLRETFYISGPIINSISNEYDCLSPLDYQFELNSLLAEYWDWEVFYMPDPDTQVFLDSESDLHSTNEVFPITFPATPDSFWVRVTAYNDTTGCVFVDSVQITITAPTAEFNFASFNVCANTDIEFNGSGSQNVNEYYWDFGDGVETGWVNTSIVNHTFTTVDTLDVWLFVRNSNGCLDSVMHQIHIIGPEIYVDISQPTYGCNSLEVTFIDNSIADEAIVRTFWVFGDGNSETGDSVSNIYDEPGVYSVTVYVETITGCLGDKTFTDTITVAQVSAAFTTPDLAACIDDEIVFSSVETNTAYTYTWNFGDGSADVIGHENVINHPYDAGGRYHVYLEVDNGLGCVSELLLENYITIEAPTAGFSLVDNSLDCYPAEADITVSNLVIPENTTLNFSWVFGSGEPIPIEDPAYLFTEPGTFDIVLTITTPAGCTSSFTEQIIVDGPYAQASISDTTVCVGQVINFSITDQSDVDEFLWILGDGDTTTNVSFPHHYTSVPPSGFYPVVLRLREGDCFVEIRTNVYIYDVTAGILITDTASNIIDEGQGHCSPFEVNLNSNSTNDDFRDWFINGSPVGTGGSSESHVFENTGALDETVTISLEIEDVNGCRDTAITTIEVYALPQIIISSDTTICKGDAISIYATGGENYLWSPDIAISDTTIQFPVVNPDTDITYLVDVVNAHGCHNSDSVHIIVQQDFDVIVTPAIDSIVIGDTVYSVLVASQDNLTYSWNPTEFASCIDCPMPFFIPEESMRYTVTVEDSAHCFRYSYYIDIIVREEYTLDVPGAFTPLSANSNSIVYADGFGIRKLLQFRIYNRWGEEVFYTDDITKGWNGYYNGQLQNIDTYSYYVEAEMFDGSIQSKTGHIMLIR